MSSITLKDMENEVRFMNGSGGNDISISNDLGNIIELNDINDTLGLDMIANTRMMSSNEPSRMPALAEVETRNISSFEPVTINLSEPSYPPFQAEVKKEDNNIFLNNQSSSSPSLSLEQPQSRISSEEEKKEKMEYLNKLQRLEQKGYPVSRRFTLDNSLSEIKDEFDRLVDARSLEASLRFQRQALMGVITGLEWANTKFDPFDLKLDGWSESVHENVDDFDEIFEELYDKYKERGKMAPEARLVMALAGSGFMCHVSIARQVAGAAASAAGPGFGNFMNMAMNSGRNAQNNQPPQQMFNAPPNAPQNIAATEPSTQQSRREMKGPTGVDDILKTFEEARRNDVYMMPESISTVTQPAVAAAVEIQSLHSEEMMSQAESARTGRGGGRRKRTAVGNSVSLAV